MSADPLLHAIVHGFEAALPSSDVAKILAVQRSNLQQLQDTHATLVGLNGSLEELTRKLVTALQTAPFDIQGIREDADFAYKHLRMLASKLEATEQHPT